LKKPKRRRTGARRNQVRAQALPAASKGPGTEIEIGDMLAGMMRARLALMPPLVADDYRALTLREGLTVAEKAKVSVLEDTYSPSRQQIEAAIAELPAKSKGNRFAA
jgi:hypothetical protein